MSIKQDQAFCCVADLVLFNIGMTFLWWYDVNPMLAATVLLLIINPWSDHRA